MLIVLRKSILYVSLLIPVVGSFVLTPGIAAQDEARRKVTKRVQPDYPPVAKQLRLSGTVKMTAVVTPEGKVKSTHITGGNAILASAAEDAVKQWKYESSPKESNELVEVQFESPQ
jgi:TonB family protein